MILTWIARVSVPRIHRIQQATTHRTYNTKHIWYRHELQEWACLEYVGFKERARIEHTYLSLLTLFLTLFLSLVWGRQSHSAPPSSFLESRSAPHSSFPVTKLIERNPPGGFPIYYIPWSRTRRKRTPSAPLGTNSSREVVFRPVLDQGT